LKKVDEEKTEGAQFFFRNYLAKTGKVCKALMKEHKKSRANRLKSISLKFPKKS